MSLGNFLILLFSLTSFTTSTNDNHKTTSTLNILELKSSKVLSNFQGEELRYANPFKSIYPIERTVLIEKKFQQSNREWQIRQIDENTFEVLGSPLEWEIQRNENR